MSSRSTTQPGKYARWECERRFRFDSTPDQFEQTAEIDVLDRYLTHTRLRVRRMTDRTSATTTYKLGQKLVATDGDLSRLEMTNMYIEQHEFEVLRSLPGDDLTKVRRRGTLYDTVVGIDEFVDRDFVIVTVDFEDAEAMAAWQPPAWEGTEVTNAEAYSGACLAQPSVTCDR